MTRSVVKPAATVNGRKIFTMGGRFYSIKRGNAYVGQYDTLAQAKAAAAKLPKLKRKK